MLSGFVDMIEGSLSTMCGKDLQFESKRALAKVNELLIDQWCNELPQTMKTKIVAKAAILQSIETDEEITALLKKIQLNYMESIH